MNQITVNDSELASWKYQKIYEEVQRFKSSSPENHVVSVELLTGSGVIPVSSIAYQNPDMLYFYGNTDSSTYLVIQHVNQISLQIVSYLPLPEQPSKPEIGFRGQVK